MRRHRTTLHFTEGSGLAQWAADQLSVRLGQAWHLHEGAPNEELSHVTVDGDTLVANFFWPPDRDDLVDDTNATLTAPSLVAQLRSDVVSSIDVHVCRHDTVPPSPCEQPYWTWHHGEEPDEEGDIQPEDDTPDEWVQPAGGHDAYQTGDRVTHNGKTWESDADGNTYEPGYWGWTEVTP